MKHLFLLFLTFMHLSVSAQQWDWARKADLTASDESPSKIATDDFGNVYLFGSSNGGNKYGTTTLAAGYFIVKFDSLGHVIWAHNMNMTGNGSITNCNVDHQGNIYLTGHFYYTFSIASFTFVSNGWEDIFVVKLNSAGNPLWGRRFGGTGGDLPGSIAIDTDGSVYFDGVFGEPISFDSYTLTDSSEHFFLTKLNSSGNALWATKGDASFGCGQLIVLDHNSNIYVVGFSTDHYYGSYIAKFDTGGNMLSHYLKWGVYDYVPTFAVANSGNIYALHNGNGHYSFLPILVKYDSLMNEQWSQVIGTYYGCYQFATDLFIDDSENIYIGGSVGTYYCNDDSVYFLDQLAYVGHDGIPAIIKFNTSGNLQWIKEGSAADYDWMSGLCRSQTGNFYATGTFNNSTAGDGDTLSFGPYTMLNDGNWEQIYVAKLGLASSPTPLIEMAATNSHEIFPNPSSGIFTLQLYDSHGDATLSVCDVLGNCVLQKKCGEDVRQEINLSKEPKGIYFMEIVSDGKRSVDKIILQ